MIGEIIEQIDAKKDQYIELLRGLIRIPSMTGEEGGAQEVVARQYRKMNLEVDIWEPDVAELFDKYPEVAQYPSHWQHDLVIPYGNLPTYTELVNSKMTEILNYRGRPNVVGRLKGVGGGRSLILNAHIDTVTIEPRDAWTHDPFSAEVVDGRIFGRGASDDKSGIVSAIAAVQTIIELGIKLRGDVILESVVNEEHSGNGTLSCIARGYVADAAIGMESSENMVRLGCYGAVYWGVNIYGNSLHTKNRWKGDCQAGVSAIEKLPVIIGSLLKLERDQNRRQVSGFYKGEKPFSLNIGRVSGGSYDTASASKCSLKGSIYFGPDIESVKEVMDSFRRYVIEDSEQDPWLKDHPPEVLFYHHDDSHRMSPDSEIVKVIQESGERVLGEKPKIMVGIGANDCRHLVNQGKMPAVVVGPGGLKQSHTIDESVNVSQFVDNIKILAATIYNWCR